MFWVGYLNSGGIRRAELGGSGGGQKDGRHERDTCLFLKFLTITHCKPCTTCCGNTVFNCRHANEVTVVYRGRKELTSRRQGEHDS